MNQVFDGCSDSVGWSDEIKIKTPPAGGSDELNFLAFGDMGKAPLDSSAEHYIQVSLSLFSLSPTKLIHQGYETYDEETSNIIWCSLDQ